MARPRGRPPGQLSKSAKSTPVKRKSEASSDVTTRQSKRVKTISTPPSTATKPRSRTTPKKSQFFEKDSASSEAESEIAKEESGYEDEDASASAVSSPPSSEDEDEGGTEYDSEDERPKRGRQTKAKGGPGVMARIVEKGKELWRAGVKTGLAPGEQVFIKLPKAREPGKIPYQDDTIHPNTILFLGDLKQNNDREWLKVHDADFRQSEKDFDSFVEKLTENLMEKDGTIPELPPKDLKFRIYRDVRFSKDPTPYKTHFSAAWSRTGRKGPYAAYYVQIAPGRSFVGGGLWQPDSAPLALLRQEVDQKSHKIKKVLVEPRLRKEFFNGIPKDEKKAVKAFASHNKENALKSKPTGYTVDNPNIELLKLRNYTIGRKLKDEEVLGPKGLGRITDLLGILTPFVTFLNSVVMPDGESSDDEEAQDQVDDQDDEAHDEEA